MIENRINNIDNITQWAWVRNWWMKWFRHLSPPCLNWDRIIHNSISYLNLIYCVGFRSGCGASTPTVDTVRSWWWCGHDTSGRISIVDLIIDLINDLMKYLINDLISDLINDLIIYLINDFMKYLINDLIADLINDLIIDLIYDLSHHAHVLNCLPLLSFVLLYIWGGL